MPKNGISKNHKIGTAHARKLKFIDLFAGIGGTRVGFEKAAKSLGFDTECVFTSEIKRHAVKIYQDNFPGEKIHGDITKIASSEIPDFDFLLAGFPCQPFSSAGKGHGFMDTRGTLFFEVERILKDKQPYGFLLENVEGLVTHDRVNPKSKVGRTLETILKKLELLGYKTNWALLNSYAFGVPQNRKRIYIIGTKDHFIPLEFKHKEIVALQDILEHGLPTMDTPFTKKLLSKFKVDELYGKSIKDKRGGDDNIHSWDLELKGPISNEQKQILNFLLKERRKKHWAIKKGITWMDGMPLTYEEISSVLHVPNLKDLLDDLVSKRYLRFEHPKDLVAHTDEQGNVLSVRKHNSNIEKGYNIVTGKLSFEINKILDPNGFAPTLVATDVEKLAVVDGNGVRRLSMREGLRLFGFPDTFTMELPMREGFDLLGNTVVVNVIEAVSTKLLNSLLGKVEIPEPAPKPLSLFQFAEGS